MYAPYTSANWKKGYAEIDDFARHNGFSQDIPYNTNSSTKPPQAKRRPQVSPPQSVIKVKRT